MSLAPGIACDAELLETLRLVLSTIPPRKLEDYARSTPSFLNDGELTGLASRHGAKGLSPTALLPLF